MHLYSSLILFSRNGHRFSFFCVLLFRDQFCRLNFNQHADQVNMWSGKLHC
uniref:Uncharacterized protein n=1 Tax=Anguilla anguilla TaxID=7936 RepID=A0A0E9WNV5_ANGAN